MSTTRRLSWSMMLTVEPVLFFYAFGFFMNIPIAQQYVYKRLSEARGFPYYFQQDDGDTGCGSKLNDTMKKLEKEVYLSLRFYSRTLLLSLNAKIVHYSVIINITRSKTISLLDSSNNNFNAPSRTILQTNLTTVFFKSEKHIL